jgi:hypothetical protein
MHAFGVIKMRAFGVTTKMHASGVTTKMHAFGVTRRKKCKT